MNLFKFARYCSYHFISDNFHILALNARIAQLLNEVIRVGADAGDLVEERGCGSERSITGETWLGVLILVINLQVRGERLFLYLLPFFNCDINLVSKFKDLYNFSI